MADTYTTYYNLTKPQVGADPDTWGGLLNTNFDTIDSQLHTASTYALPLTGGTLSGFVKQDMGVLSSTGGTNVDAFQWQMETSNVDTLRVKAARVGAGSGWDSARWVVYREVDTTVHGFIQFGEQAGGQGLAFGSGSTLYATMTGTGQWNFSNRPTWAGATPWDSANFNPASYAALSGASFSGAVEALAGFQTAGATTAFNGQGAYIGWNRHATGVSGSFIGEMDFINHKGGGQGGFAFFNTDGTTYTQLSSLDYNGKWQAADFSATSDERLKDNIRPLRRGVDELKRMLPREYIKGGREEVGFIAQEVQKVLPEAVSEGMGGFLGVSYGQVTALLARAILEIDARLSLLGG